jgi:Kef-type K+ transport system membrane component KefB
MVTGVIQAAAAGTTLGGAQVALIVAKAVVFLVGALVIGGYLAPRVFDRMKAFPSVGGVQAVSLSLCFLLAYLAWRAGLGMMPRGEVGLVFAGIGAQLMFEGEPARSGSGGNLWVARLGGLP